MFNCIWDILSVLQAQHFPVWSWPVQTPFHPCSLSCFSCWWGHCGSFSELGQKPGSYPGLYVPWSLGHQLINTSHNRACLSFFWPLPYLISHHFLHECCLESSNPAFHLIPLQFILCPATTEFWVQWKPRKLSSWVGQVWPEELATAWPFGLIY